MRDLHDLVLAVFAVLEFDEQIETKIVRDVGGVYEVRSWFVSVFFFFFQAEDGIRDLTVTGVQTCALPIYLNLLVITDVCLCEYTDHGHCGVIENGEVANDATLEILAQQALSHARAGEIGRASCRERV